MSFDLVVSLGRLFYLIYSEFISKNGIEYDPLGVSKERGIAMNTCDTCEKGMPKHRLKVLDSSLFRIE